MRQGRVLKIPEKTNLMILISFRSYDTPSGWILSAVDTVGVHLDIFGLGQMIDGEHPTSPTMCDLVVVRPCDVGGAQLGRMHAAVVVPRMRG